MATDPLISSTVGGCLILEIIGQGGMGVIYKARQKSLDRVVALKVLAPHLANDVNFVGRFQREARAIARVNHPNILAVYDVGDDQNVNYMIMELIDGQSLAELQTDRHGALPWEEACAFVKQAAQGLEAAQASGIIHRDIKPENLMVTKKNVIKVSDFGLAKDADSTTTSTDAVMGTPAFMSPEQCDGKKVDGRSDIYSLGGTFYRLVTGRLPFEAETAMSMMYRHKHEALIPPHEVVPSMPPAISAIIVKMMAKKRELRYQTMTEVIDSIDQARQQPVFANPARLPEATADHSLPPEPSSGLEPFGDVARPMGLLGQDDSHASGRRPQPASLAPPGQSERRTAASNRMPAASAPPGGFGSPDSSSRMSMPSGVMGAGLNAGLAVPDDAYAAIGAGDEALARGDKVNAIKCYRKALQSRSLDNATRGRVDAEVRKELTSRRQHAENFLKKGMLVEASREYRVLTDIDAADENAKANLKDVEGKLAQKRTLQNDIRTAIASSQFEKAIKIWDAAPAELRDDAMAKQIEGLRTINVPALKLAEQGESFARQGRLEESMATFEDALKINPACEPARIGLKEAETKIQRIEFMLKEGYQCSLEQNYTKAIETWKPILQIRPGHPQTVKSMVDAYIAHAQYLRSQGNLEAALNAYKGAAEVDPQNRTARKTVEELTNLYDKEAALIDRANDAAARNNLSGAIRYWKDVTKVNPANKKAAQQVAQLSKDRSGGRMKKLVAFVVVAGAILAGYQYYTEYTLLGAIKQSMSDSKYGEVKGRVSGSRIVFMGKEIYGIRDEAALFNRWQIAMQELNGRIPGGRQTLEDLLKLGWDTDPSTEKRRMFMLTAKALAEDGVLTRNEKADAALTEAINGNDMNARSRLDAAKEALLEIRELVAQAKFPDDVLMQKGSLAELQAQAVDEIKNGLINKNNKLPQLAQQAFKQALTRAGLFKIQGLEAYLKKQLAELGQDDERARAALKSAIEAIGARDEATGQHTRLKEAAESLKIAQSSIEVEKQAAQLLRYVEDLKSCEQKPDGSEKNMRMYQPLDPLTSPGPTWWGNNEHNRAFCVDRFEYPNKENGPPMANITYQEAARKCTDERKVLCGAIEWENVCKGGSKFNEQYPYGPAAVPGNCNTDGSSVEKSGSKGKCHNAIGVYDMSGNVAEWVDGGGDAQMATVKGGSYKNAAAAADCLFQEQRDKTKPHKDVGFRCCQFLP